MSSLLPRVSSVRRIARGFFAVALLSFVLAGCLRFLEPRPGQDITYYLLDSRLRPDTISTDTTGITVGLRRPHLAAYLDAARIVTRRGPNAIQFSEFHRWGEELDRAVNRVVARHLERESGVQSVEVVPWPEGTRFDYIVQLRVLHFEGVGPPLPDPEDEEKSPPPTGHSEMLVRWTIFGPNGQTSKAEGITRHREENWTVTDYSALATKLDTSLAVLARDIGARLQSFSSSEQKSR